MLSFFLSAIFHKHNNVTKALPVEQRNFKLDERRHASGTTMGRSLSGKGESVALCGKIDWTDEDIGKRKANLKQHCDRVPRCQLSTTKPNTASHVHQPASRVTL